MTAAWRGSRQNKRELGVSEASDSASRQVSEDDEPAEQGREGEHDVADTGMHEACRLLAVALLLCSVCRL